MDDKGHVSNVTSYKKDTLKHFVFNPSLDAWVNTLFMVVSFLPGVLFGTMAKSISYLTSNEMKKKRIIAKKHLTPKEVSIGGSFFRKTAKEITKEIKKLKSDPFHPKINHLVIHAKDEQLEDDCDLLELKPNKIILSGIDFYKSEKAYTQFSESRKWRIHDQKNDGFGKTFSINQAIIDKPATRSFWPYKKYHTLYVANN